MRLGTHVSGGILGYTVAATFFHLPWTATGLVVAGAAAAAPDVDTLGSTVGRVFAPLARRIERRFGHRTITHCYAAQAAVALLALPLLWPALPGGPLPHLYAAVVVGYLSHPFLDTWTTQGVRVFWPWSDRRGVFPYYNRQETAYRTRTGSRADSVFGVVFVCLTVPFAVVQVDGYQRLVRRLQADAPAAVRDFLDWSADGYLVSVDVEASDPQHLRRLAGRFEAIGTTGEHTLLVRDTTSGRVFSLGPAYSADFQPDRVLARRGAHVTVASRPLDMAGRVLADLEALVPRTASGQPVRHLIDGLVTLSEAAGITPSDGQFDTVTGTDRRLSLQFATLADLDRLDLAGVVVETGTLTLRTFLQDDESPLTGDGATLARSSVRRVSFAHAPADIPDLRLAEGDVVAVGDTVAVLASAALTIASLDVADARADLAAAQAETLPASFSPVALQARLAAAEVDTRRADERLRNGFEPPAAVEAARTVADDLRAALAQAAARESDWRRGQAERIRTADARLQRATHRRTAAARAAVVLSTGAGVVRRVERREHGPGRTEVRLVLVTPRSSTGRSAPGRASPLP